MLPGVSHFLCLANGTDALEIALRAVECEAGDEVITVADAGGYATTACRIIGAVPVYVDIARETLLMDVAAVPATISERTKAVVATHLYGGVVDVEALRSCLNAAGFGAIAIVEDWRPGAWSDAARPQGWQPRQSGCF